MYVEIKQALVRSQKKTAPLNFATGEIIQDRAQQTDRWVEHYPELSARENMVSLEALNATECLLWIINLKEALEYLHLEKRVATINGDALPVLEERKVPQ